MTVPIDSSRPYRWPSELTELVEAVTRADPNNESTWIEWKSTLDLRDKSGHYHVAKHVLGFANRSVATARRHADGHAYMIIGAEPGSLAGIEPVDPAVLHPKIVRYVGPAVRWRAEYVSLRGRDVLVAVVDPPEHGDPIHPVRHQLDVHPNGRILVRRPGSTDPADAFEIDQLVQRVRSGGGELEISVEPISPIVERWPSLPNVDELTDAERAATIARPRADAPRPSRPGEPFAMRAYRIPTTLASAFEEPDKRSDEDYQNEVDRYSKTYEQALLERSVWRLRRHRPICLQLEAINLTESNFTDIELEIHVPGDVRSWPEELDDLRRGDEPALPERPPVLGTPKPRFPFGDVLYPRAAALESYRMPSINTGPSFTVRDTGSITIDFSGIDLRPQQRLELPLVRLLVDAPDESVLDCEWKATAGNVPRRLSGRFSVTVRPSTLSFDDLQIDRKSDVDKDD